MRNQPVNIGLPEFPRLQPAQGFTPIPYRSLLSLAKVVVDFRPDALTDDVFHRMGWKSRGTASRYDASPSILTCRGTFSDRCRAIANAVAAARIVRVEDRYADSRNQVSLSITLKSQ